METDGEVLIVIVGIYEWSIKQSLCEFYMPGFGRLRWVYRPEEEEEGGGKEKISQLNY